MATSTAIIWVLLMWMGGTVDRIVLMLCVAVPVVTACPVMTYLFILQNRLKRSYEHLQIVYSELQERSRIDQMTGVLNRESFFNMMRNARAEVEEGVLLAIDVDHFKRINDTYGHAVGDRALRHIAFILQNYTNKNGIVGRVGGEEFCIYIPHADADDGYQFARHLCAEVERIPLIISEHENYRMTISIGASQAFSGETNSQVLRRADRCLYKAKSAGRNCVIFDHQEDSTGRLERQERVRYAN
ncbi:GGDEF domain-containing protein [Daeguia caeni]|uniref:diguanylate cyclase n=1 Tax=Daeguia caeni TaxID=439612 RepID=A0ABV9H6V8_9HYPH